MRVIHSTHNPKGLYSRMALVFIYGGQKRARAVSVLFEVLRHRNRVAGLVWSSAQRQNGVAFREVRPKSVIRNFLTR